MSFVTLNTGLSGLRASQTSLDITSNNIANVGTPGYTRQRVQQSPSIPYDSPVGQVGTGVTVDDIVRLRDTFLDARVRATTANWQRDDQLANVLERAEQVLGEPDNGITTELNELWASLETLALDPSSLAVRTSTLEQLEALAARVRDTSAGLAQLSDQTVILRDDLLREAQDLLQSVADANLQIAGDPTNPNLDLQDKRDFALDRLAELLGTTSTTDAENVVTVELNGTLLVGGGAAPAGYTNGFAATLGTDLATADGRLTVEDTTGGNGPGGAATVVATADVNGEIGGVLQALTTELPDLVADIDLFVAELSTALNTTHALGFTDAGAVGGTLLSGTAANLTVDVTDPADLALKGAAATGTGDNRNALGLAGLREGMAGVFDAERPNQIPVRLGADVAAARRRAEASADIATSATVSRSSQHSVSLDEEMVALVQYQRALEANSRIMTAADEILNTIINRLGVVGR